MEASGNETQTQPSPPRMTLGRFLLAHHFSSHLDRCYRVGSKQNPLYLCARCLGIYPALALTLTLLFALKLAPHRWDWVWLYLLPLPAVIDFGLFRLGIVKGSNLRRTLVGIPLGLALGRMLQLHFLAPYNQQVVFQWLGLFAAWLAIELLGRWQALREPRA